MLKLLSVNFKKDFVDLYYNDLESFLDSKKKIQEKREKEVTNIFDTSIFDRKIDFFTINSDLRENEIHPILSEEIVPEK